MQWLQKAMRLAQIANQSHAPSADEIVDMHREGYDVSRRKFLTNATKAGVILGASAFIPEYVLGGTPPPVRIAIVGGGIAGLTAGHYLKKAGINSFTIYEADKRLGGRIFTKKDVLGKDLRTEFGGEYIDSNHKDMFKLIKEFGLTTIDTSSDPLPLKKDAYFFNGRHYTLEEVVREFQAIAPKIAADQGAIDEDYSNIATQKLDNTSLEEYLKNLEAPEWFTQMLDTAYKAEYGAATGKQSSLNFVDMIDTQVVNNEFKIFGESDERYKISGGNGMLMDVMSRSLQNYVQPEMKLTGIYSVGKRYLLVFNERVNIETDIVILTVPFSVLKGIPMQLEGLTAEKKQCIQDLGYGTNAKLMMGFNKRVWRDNGYAGYVVNEMIHNGWDNGLFQNSPTNAAVEGGFTVYLGGDTGLDIQRGYEQELVKLYLPELERIYPGAEAQYNNKCAVADWPLQPLYKGSYAYYKTGQWTTISGMEMEPVGNVYFAGEHCSSDSQGFMNGGAETGRVVAQTILKKMKAKPAN